jgi:hypothetical protein
MTTVKLYEKPLAGTLVQNQNLKPVETHVFEDPLSARAFADDAKFCRGLKPVILHGFPK